MQIEQIQKQIGKSIAIARKKNNLTMEKLAYEVGISKGYLSDIENGKRTPSIKTLALLAERLEVNMKYFFK